MSLNRLITLYEPQTLKAKTVSELNEGGVPRMRLLPGQQLKTLNGVEEEGDTKLNIQSDSRPRQENPVGTIFEVEITEKRQHFDGGEIYYSTAGYSKIRVHK